MRKEVCEKVKAYVCPSARMKEIGFMCEIESETQKDVTEFSRNLGVGM